MKEEKSLRLRAIEAISIWAQVRDTGRLKSVTHDYGSSPGAEGTDEAAATHRFIENVIRDLKETSLLSDLFAQVIYQQKPLHDIRPNTQAAAMACGRFLAAVQKAIDLQDKTKPKPFVVLEEFAPAVDPELFKKSNYGTCT